MEIVNGFDFFGFRRLLDGLKYTEGAQDRFSIVQRDPLSAKVTCMWEMSVDRGDWRARVTTTSTMTAIETHFAGVNILEAFEGTSRVFVQSRSHEILRGLV